MIGHSSSSPRLRNISHDNIKSLYIQIKRGIFGNLAECLGISYPHVIDEGNSYGHSVGVLRIYDFKKKAEKLKFFITTSLY